MKDTELYKGLVGLIGIWLTWIFGNLATVQTWASILASTAAFVASVIYARYWWLKTRKEKLPKFRQNGRDK